MATLHATAPVPVVLRMEAPLDRVQLRGASGRVPLAAIAALRSETEPAVLLHEGELPMVGATVQTGDAKALEKLFHAPEGMQYRVIPIL
ncbi:MAG TPA: hypothetical protein VGL81_02900 [Polyangiaceae bacterium]